VENIDDVPQQLSSEAHGIILGPLQAHLVDGIQVGDVVLRLSRGTTCSHSIGTLLRVTYTEHEGIKEARHIARVEW
jgi:hypothetical protein